MAPNKFLAKIASGWKKPDGLTVIAPERVDAFVRDLPVDALWGVGPKTAARLREHGIHTLSDVRSRSLHELKGVVGSLAEWLLALAHGQDDRPVEPNRPTKQSGSECTYREDLTRLADIHREVDEMARDAAAWLERRQLFARTVVLKVRYSDFTTITRSHSTRTATRDPGELAARALALSAGVDRKCNGRHFTLENKKGGPDQQQFQSIAPTILFESKLSTRGD